MARNPINVMGPNNCDMCGNSESYFVKVGDCAYGNDVEEWCCKADDLMTDKDVESSNHGFCPHFKPREAE